MKFIDYIEERIWFVIFQVSVIFLISIYFKLFELPIEAVVILDVIWILGMMVYLFVSYSMKKKEYDEIISIVDNLEEKYLIAEILKKPKNFKNKAYYYALKKACKSMNDKIVDLEIDIRDYHDYIESFVHEIKTPISAISLLCDNRQDMNIKSQVNKINNFVEQMLFYARSDSVEKDYFIRKISLEDLVHTVIMDYRENLMQNRICLDIDNLQNCVYTDEKWLVFIIGQILQNSIKYMDKEDKLIKIYSLNKKNKIVLVIEDNGQGIRDCDLPRVFDYGFTGTDRNKEYSTGIGLYLCKKLCDRLNLSIDIESVYKKFTRVTIVFPKTNLYKEDIEAE